MDGERSVDFDFRFAVFDHGPADARGDETDLGILLAFENVPMHLLVASAVAAIAAGGVDGDFSAA